MEKEAGLRPGVASSSRFLDDSGDLRRRVGWRRRRERGGDAFAFIGFAGFFDVLAVNVGVWGVFTGVLAVVGVWGVFTGVLAVVGGFVVFTGVLIVVGGFVVFTGVLAVVGGRVVVEENEIGAGPLDGERELVRFPTVELLRRPTAFGDAADASRSGRFDENNEIDVAFPTDFEEKRRVEDGEFGVGGANGVEPTTKAGEQGRARRSVQKVELDSRFVGRRENDFGQTTAVDGSVRRDDRSAPTVAEDVENRRVVEKAARFDVRVETGEAERSKRGGRETLAGTDSSDDGEKERAVFRHY